MPARLTSGPLDAARTPLDRVVIREPALGGLRALAGVIAPKSGDWRAALAPHLYRTEELRQNTDYVMALFFAPVELDCAALGAALPMLRHVGLLTTVGIDGAPPDILTALKGNVLLLEAGKRKLAPEAGFTPLPIAELWDVESIAVTPLIDLPKAEIVELDEKTLKTVAATPSDPADKMAGFGDIRKRMNDRIRPGLGERLREGATSIATSSFVSGFLRISTITGLGFLLYLILSQVNWGSQTPGASVAPDASSGDLGEVVLMLFRFFIGLMFFVLAVSLISLFWKPMPDQTLDGGPWGARPASEGGPVRRFWRRIAQALSRQDTIPGSGSGSTNGHKPSGGSEPQAGKRQRSRLSRLASWLVWKTPAGNRVAEAFQRRLAEVQKAFDEGRIEEALKKAIALGGDNAEKELNFGDLPLAPPAMRDRLDLNMSGASGASFGGMSPEGYHALQNLYRAKANAMIAEGRIDYAAFIFAELLNDPRGAVDALIKAGQLETAARLAQARRLAPGLFIPLWFRAGDKKRALALAAQYDGFEELWKEVQPDDPFHAVLAQEWAQRLAQSGNLARAVEVTDLPDMTRLPAALLRQRVDWLEQIIDGYPDGGMIARAMKVLPWEPDDDSKAMRAFELALNSPEDNLRIDVALGLQAALERDPHSTLPAGKLAWLGHRLTRQLVADQDRFGHMDQRVTVMSGLSAYTNQLALRVDLRRLARNPVVDRPRDRVLTIDWDGHGAAIIDAATVERDRALLGYRSGLVRLVDLGGRELWRAQIDGLRQLVPVGAGALCFAVSTGFGQTFLTVIDTRAKQTLTFGEFPVGWANSTASENGWIVSSGRDIVMLDTPALLAQARSGRPAEDGLVRHWAIPMSETGIPLFAADGATAMVLGYQRIDGLIEWWTLSKRDLKIDQYFWTDAPVEGGQVKSTCSLRFSHGRANLRGAGANQISLHTATREQELKMLETAEFFVPPRFAVTSRDGQLQCMIAPAETFAGARATFDLADKASLGVNVHDVADAQVRPSFGLPRAILFDETGRAALIDGADASLYRLA